MFNSLKEVQEAFLCQDYICSPKTATVVYLACKLNKPLLVEGPAGVGKTDLAKVLAESQKMQLIRMQCYEGLDETKALYEWEYSKQLLYTQLLKERVSELLQNCCSISQAIEEIAQEDGLFFSERFLVYRPLLKAIKSEYPTVLLIDELDKADQEFEAFLLEILSDFQVSIPEIGTLSAYHIPQVVLTSNSSRELSDALRRRCLYLYLDFPTAKQEEAILSRKLPQLDSRLRQQVVTAVQSIRKLDLKKLPSVGETLDWAKSLIVLNADKLDKETIISSLFALLKSPSDQELVLKETETHSLLSQIADPHLVSASKESACVSSSNE